MKILPGAVVNYLADVNWHCLSTAKGLIGVAEGLIEHCLQDCLFFFFFVKISFTLRVTISLPQSPEQIFE